MQQSQPAHWRGRFWLQLALGLRWLFWSWRGVIVGLAALAALALLVVCNGSSVPECLHCFWKWARWEDASNSETLRNLGLGIGALVFAPVGIGLAVWRNMVAERELRNDRYQKGADMLGNTSRQPTRLGGIHALEQLASERPEEYHVAVMKLLCDFVRNPVEAEKNRNESCPPDVAAAVQVIGRRGKLQRMLEKADRNFIMNLTDTNLKDADMTGANLEDARLNHADLTNAWLNHGNLARANLTDTNLSNAKLREVTGLTQDMLDKAFIWKGTAPPNLAGAFCADTGKPLEWNGEERDWPDEV